MILLDTDHLSIAVDARHAGQAGLWRRLAEADDEVAIPVIAVEEVLRGWLARIHRERDPHRQTAFYQRLVDFLEFAAEFRIIGWTRGAADVLVRWKSQRVRIGAQDLKIAATAVAHEALLLSANLRDFERVPGLRVETWLSG